MEDQKENKPSPAPPPEAIIMIVVLVAVMCILFFGGLGKLEKLCWFMDCSS